METNAAKPRQNKKRKGGPIHNDVLKELRRPVRLHKSRAEKRLELIQAQRQALKLEAGLRKLAGQLREEETKLQREIRHEADPELVLLLQARLIPIQKRLVSLHAQLDTVSMPSAADVDDDDDCEDNGSDEKENGRHDAEEDNGSDEKENGRHDAEEDEDEDEGEDEDAA